jgi:hypothetical protein
MGPPAFAGMRKRMCGWLDDVRVGKWIGLDTDDLFGERSNVVHTTSLIRYPVFVGPEGTHYSGSSPVPVDSPLLRDHRQGTEPELKRTSDALIVPMGRAVATSLRKVGVDADGCLFGFSVSLGCQWPWPGQFAKERRAMCRVVASLPLPL